MKYFLVLIFVIISTFVGVSGNKYAQNMNKKVDLLNQDRIFRSNKLNLIWQKGKKRLSEQELMRFRVDMDVQDKLEMDLKRIKAEDQDGDGEHEASIRRKFIAIMKRYGLLDIVDDRLANELPGDRIDGDPRRPRMGKFDGPDAIRQDGPRRPEAPMDNRLNRIWKKAQTSGFSEEELLKLRQELDHQQEKMDEYNTLRNTANSFQTDNSVHRFEEKDAGRARERKLELKQQYTDLKENYDVLEAYVAGDASQRQTEFKEPRVQGLWHMAQRANFSEVELDSFREELQHFEKKLEKKEFLKKEFDRQTQKKTMVDPDNTEFHDRYQQMEDRVKDFDRRVKKTHTELKYRVSHGIKMRNEL